LRAGLCATLSEFARLIHFCAASHVASTPKFDNSCNHTFSGFSPLFSNAAESHFPANVIANQ
jgi:hypothetical protein